MDIANDDVKEKDCRLHDVDADYLFYEVRLSEDYQCPHRKQNNRYEIWEIK